MNKFCGVWTDSGGYQRGTFDSAGLIALADAIRGMVGALSVANLGARSSWAVCRVPGGHVSLCGITQMTPLTGADLSGIGMDADDAVIPVSELPYKALSSLILASNNIGGTFDRHGTHIAYPLRI
jgi:hypothetical protein